jgi:hypothetical protein
MSEPEPELLQSLDRALEESRKLRKESGLLLEKAQWPEFELTQQEESSPPVPDLLHIPVPPLLGFQRDKGNLPLGQPAQLLETNLRNTSQKPATPAGQNPSLSEGELLEARIPELIGSV